MHSNHCCMFIKDVMLLIVCVQMGENMSKNAANGAYAVAGTVAVWERILVAVKMILGVHSVAKIVAEVEQF